VIACTINTATARHVLRVDYSVHNLTYVSPLQGSKYYMPYPGRRRAARPGAALGEDEM